MTNLDSKSCSEKIIFEKQYICSFDSKKIHTYTSNNIGNKIIIICHGMAEHFERYYNFANELIKNNYIVFGYNQRGHYLTDSKDNYGYMDDKDNFEILVKDLNFFINYLKDKYNLPIYLFGHSMGSFVSTRFVQIYNNKLISGLILSGSGLNNNFLLSFGISLGKIIKTFKGKKYRSKLLDKITFGSFNNKFKPSRTPFDWLNTDKTEVDKYINDEYCGGIFTVSYFIDFFKGCKKISKNFSKINKDLPILIISGLDDPVGNMGKGVTKLSNKIKKFNSDIQIKLYQNARHEILLERDKDIIIRDIISWLDRK